MKKWQRRARTAVRDTIARYTWCGDFGDVDGFVACFAADAVLTIKGGETFEGHAGIRRLGGGGSGAPDRGDGQARRGPLRHHVSSVRIEVGSRDHARAWAYFLVLGPHGPDHWGRYADEFVPAGDGDIWLFHRRRVSIDGAVPGSNAARYLQAD